MKGPGMHHVGLVIRFLNCSGNMGRASSKLASAQRSKAHQDENSKDYVRTQQNW